MSVSTEKKRPVLIGCGIFKKEIKQLVRKNHWPVETRFLDSSLHVDFDRLSAALTGSLTRYKGVKTLVVYGTCHPRMEEMLAVTGARRTPGQNCVEILLGKDRFTDELSKGAYFLFEDWAKRWDQVSRQFSKRTNIMREIFQDAHKYLLAIRTPCSGDFQEQAKYVSDQVDLPLYWTDVDLENLEHRLRQSINDVFEEAKE